MAFGYIFAYIMIAFLLFITISSAVQLMTSKLIGSENVSCHDSSGYLIVDTVCIKNIYSCVELPWGLAPLKNCGHNVFGGYSD